MNHNNIIQSFYPNKLLLFFRSALCFSSAIIIQESIDNKYKLSGLNDLISQLPYIPYLLIIICWIYATISLICINPSFCFVKITSSGILYKNPFTLFHEEQIDWILIEDFYIHPLTFALKYVKIKFNRNYDPLYHQKNLLIPGDPLKVITIMKEYLKNHVH